VQRQPTSIGIKNLLGLNLKFCLSRKSLPKDINQTILRMARSIRICHLLQSSGLNPTSHYEKQIYIKNSNWPPPPAPLTIENKITEFEKALKDKQRHLETKYTKRNLSNLTPFQTKILLKLRQNTNIIIKLSGKNLGPAVLDTSRYTTQVLEEHLLTKDYRQLSREDALYRIDQLIIILKKTDTRK
jgi:hypothetical protein